jgi:hypothetical protein
MKSEIRAICSINAHKILAAPIIIGMMYWSTTHLLLNNQEIREVIDTITSRAVLILGRFSGGRKPILDAIRDEHQAL